MVSLTRLKEVLEGLRLQLVAFRDEDGTELFDLPGAPRPDADVTVPARFLGEYDSATWWIERDGKRRATLAIRPFRRLSRTERDDVTAEADRMLELAADDAETRAVRIEPAV